MSYKIDTKDGVIVGLSQVNPETELQHHKYIKRYLSSKGYWVYVYPDKKPAGKSSKASKDQKESKGKKHTSKGSPEDRIKPLKKPNAADLNPMRTSRVSPSKGITEQIRGKAINRAAKREADLQKYIAQQKRLMRKIRQLMRQGYLPNGPIDTIEKQKIKKPKVRASVSKMRT